MFEPQVYIERRKKLKEKLKNGILLFLGNSETPRTSAHYYYEFRQNSSFLYFFGLDHPGLVGVIDTGNDKEYIFGDDIGLENIIWTGPQETIKEKASKVGIKNTAPLKKLKEFIENERRKNRVIHYLPQFKGENRIFLSNILRKPIDKPDPSLELTTAVILIRSYKEPREIKETEKAIDIARKLHSTVAGMAKPGIHEREIVGAIKGIAYQAGGSLNFPVICSVRGETLHNYVQRNILEEGNLLLVDIYPENAMNYPADITRTYPVSGKFTQKQKEIYEIVLKANTESIKMCKPQIPYRDVHINSHKIIADGLKELGLMKGDTSRAAQQGAVALFMPHGLGHMLGLDVHDMEDLGENYVAYDKEIKRSKTFGLANLRFGRKLEQNFVVTVEPGIYFIPELIERWESQRKFAEFINYDKLQNYEGFGGIRIEDDILITKDSCKVLGSPIPKTVSEVENAIMQNRSIKNAPV